MNNIENKIATKEHSLSLRSLYSSLVREQLLRRVAEEEREVREFVRAEKALARVLVARVELAVLVLGEHEALREPRRHQQR